MGVLSKDPDADNRAFLFIGLAIICFNYYRFIEMSSPSSLLQHQLQHLSLVGCLIHLLELIHQFLVDL